jgi:hypothetical protein
VKRLAGTLATNWIVPSGQRTTPNNFMIDGTSNVTIALGTPAAILPVDAMQESRSSPASPLLRNYLYSALAGFV